MAKFRKSIRRLSSRFPIGFGVTMFLNMIFYAMVSTVLFSFLPKMVKYFGASEVETGYKAGIIATSFYIGQFVFSMAWGYAADTMQLKYALILAGTCLSITTILFGLSRTFYWAFITRFLQGSSMGHLIIFKALINVVCEEKDVAFGLSLMMSAFTVGSIVGPSIGGFLAFPADQYPRFISNENVFGKFGILMPNLVLVFGVILGIVLVIVFIPKNKKVAAKKNSLDAVSKEKNKDISKIDAEKQASSVKLDTISNKGAKENDDKEQVTITTPYVNVGYTNDNEETPPIDNTKDEIGTIKDETITDDPNQNGTIEKHTVEGVENVAIESDVIDTNIIKKDNHSIADDETIESDTTKDDVINNDTINNDTNKNESMEDTVICTEDTMDINKDTIDISKDTMENDQNELECSKSVTIKDEIMNGNPINGEISTRKTEEQNSTTNQSLDSNCKKPNKSKTSKFGQVLKSRDAILTCLLYMFFGMIDIGYNEILPILTSTSTSYRGMGMTPSQLGLILLIAPTCYFIPQVTIGPKLVTQFGPKTSFIALNIVLTFCYAILPVMAAIHNRAALNVCLIAVIIVIRVSVFGCMVAINILINNSVAANLLGTINGAASSAIALGRLVAPICFGSIYSWSLTNIVGVRGNNNPLGFPFNQFFTFFVLSLGSVFIAVFTTLLPDSINEKKK